MVEWWSLFVVECCGSPGGYVKGGGFRGIGRCLLFRKCGVKGFVVVLFFDVVVLFLDVVVLIFDVVLLLDVLFLSFDVVLILNVLVLIFDVVVLILDI